MELLQKTHLDSLLNKSNGKFGAANPFPHIVFDDFLPAETAERVLKEFNIPADQAIVWRHYNENKRGLTNIDEMGPTIQRLIRNMHSREFIDFLERLTGIEGLIPDPELDGGGLHETKRGGFLNMHVDFLSHTKNKHWSRQLNLLLYLNKDWRESYNGYLEFWDMKNRVRRQKIEPAFNRCVLFQTTQDSFHGYPDDVECPPDRSRKSIALYYYHEESKALKLRPTFYQYRPDDPIHQKALIVLDRLALRAYSFLKRYSLISDDVFSRITRLWK